jgi:hypothetical protein
VLLAPHSVARSKFLRRHGIVSGQALPLKNRTHFCRPFHSCFRSNLLVYLEREQNTEHIFDQDRLGGGSIKYDWEHDDAEPRLRRRAKCTDRPNSGPQVALSHRNPRFVS